MATSFLFSRSRDVILNFSENDPSRKNKIIIQCVLQLLVDCEPFLGEITGIPFIPRSNQGYWLGNTKSRMLANIINRLLLMALIIKLIASIG